MLRQIGLLFVHNTQIVHLLCRQQNMPEFIEAKDDGGGEW